MRTSNWTPTIVPIWVDQTVYLVENAFGFMQILGGDSFRLSHLLRLDHLP
jgi:hypothetical protein